MDNAESKMEQAIQSAGYQISDTPPATMESPQQAVTPQENISEANASENTQQEVPAFEPNITTQSAQIQEQQVQQTQDAAPAQVETQTESAQSSLTSTPDYSFSDFLDALVGETPAPSVQTIQEEQSILSDIDPRIKVISDFVAKTGRSPEDWFRYQALEPSEMDDKTVMLVHLASEYQSLGNDEIDLLINSKYRTDDSVYSDDEVRLATLQLKIDSEKARQSINTLRNEYMTPIVSQQAQPAVEFDSAFDDSWKRENFSSLNQLEKISFDLPGGKEFHYGIPEDYRKSLANDNSNMDAYFDKYLDKGGNWDHNLWNMHRTVTDNMPGILQNVYRQGLSDGQRTIVEKAANIDPTTPQQATQSQGNSMAQQVLDALGRHTPFLKNL